MYWECSSAGLEHSVLTRDVQGSNPCTPTNLRLASSKVERHTEDVGVGGSIPSLGTMKLSGLGVPLRRMGTRLNVPIRSLTKARLAKWSKAAVCKAAGSNPRSGPNPEPRSTIRKGMHHAYPSN